MNGKKKILATLVVCFGAVVLYNLAILGVEKKLDSVAAGRKERTPARLKMDLFSVEKASYHGVRRDIFNEPAQVKTPPDPVRRTIMTEPALHAPTPSQEEPKAPSALQAFASEAKFIGFVDNNSSRTAFLIWGQDVHAIKKDSSINKFRIQEITGGIITLKDEEASEEAKIFY